MLNEVIGDLRDMVSIREACYDNNSKQLVLSISDECKAIVLAEFNENTPVFNGIEGGSNIKRATKIDKSYRDGISWGWDLFIHKSENKDGSWDLFGRSGDYAFGHYPAYVRVRNTAGNMKRSISVYTKFINDLKEIIKG